MRILSWNVNGWKKIRTYQPFFSFSSWSAIVSHLQADIVCLQETKLTRKHAALDKEMCIPGVDWESFWDFHPSRGYSGTAVYVRTSTTPLPTKCEHGLTGRKVHDASQRIGGYPVNIKEELDGPLYESLDEEGRCVVLDFGFFVLFNLYCPVLGSEERHDFRMAFYAALDERARNLVSAGRNVIIVGDINIARQPIDHCDWCDLGSKIENLMDFYDNPARAWLNRFTQPHGPFFDTQRDEHPERRGMYTCWSTLINARPANYGTRIDYTLVSPGLKEWVKAADIQNETPGSDHCPIFVDLHDERIIDGEVVKLKNLMAPPGSLTPSPLAASRWEEFNRKDLKSFFVKAKALEAEEKSKILAFKEAEAAITEGVADRVAHETQRASPENSVKLRPEQMRREDCLDGMQTISRKLLKHFSPLQPRSTSSPTSKKTNSTGCTTSGRPSATAAKVETGKKGKQLKLGSFFSSPNPLPAGGNRNRKRRLSVTSPRPESTATPSEGRRAGEDTRSQGSPQSKVSEGFDWKYLSSLLDAKADAMRDPARNVSVGATSAWSSLFTAPPPPKCLSHGEEAKAYTVNKKCANTGRKFWLCSRDIGPGYEKGFGSSEVKREGGEYRCGFFKWNSDWEKEWKKRKQLGNQASAKRIHR